MPNAGLQGGMTDHNGTITSGSGDVSIEGRAAGRIGDSHDCGYEHHGGSLISSGSATVSINGRAAARVGDSCSCGATLTSNHANTVSIG